MARVDAIIAAPARCPNPSAATNAPTRAGPDQQEILAHGGYELLQRECPGVHYHCDRQHPNQSAALPGETERVSCTSPERWQRGGYRRLREPQTGDQPQIVHMDEQQKDVGRRVAGKLDQYPADHRTHHLAHVLGDDIQRHCVDDSVPADDVENPGASRWVLNRLGRSLDEGHYENVPGLQCPEVIQHHGQQPAGGDQVDGLREEHDPLSGKPVGNVAGDRGYEGPRHIVEDP